MTQVFLSTPAILTNITYDLNDSDLSLNWTVVDFFVSNPSYVILLNGTQIDSGGWSSGAPISLSLNDLELESGIYNITIIVNIFFLIISNIPVYSQTN